MVDELMKFSRDDDNTHIKFIFREKLRFRKMFVRNFRYYFFFGPIFFYSLRKREKNWKFQMNICFDDVEIFLSAVKNKNTF